MSSVTLHFKIIINHKAKLDSINVPYNLKIDEVLDEKRVIRISPSVDGTEDSNMVKDTIKSSSFLGINPLIRIIIDGYTKYSNEHILHSTQSSFTHLHTNIFSSKNYKIFLEAIEITTEPIHGELNKFTGEGKLKAIYNIHGNQVKNVDSFLKSCKAKCIDKKKNIYSVFKIVHITQDRGFYTVWYTNVAMVPLLI